MWYYENSTSVWSEGCQCSPGSELSSLCWHFCHGTWVWDKYWSIGSVLFVVQLMNTSTFSWDKQETKIRKRCSMRISFTCPAILRMDFSLTMQVCPVPTLSICAVPSKWFFIRGCFYYLLKIKSLDRRFVSKTQTGLTLLACVPLCVVA